jgi:hypothetical protein
MVMRVHGERLIQAEPLRSREANESASDRKTVPTTAVRQAPENPSEAPGGPRQRL